MAEPKELPQMVTELVDLSKDYLRQETLEPARRLGRYASFSVGAAVLFGGAAVLLTLGFHALMRRVLPDTAWWGVLAKLFTALMAAGVAGITIWRMSGDDHPR